MAEYRAQAEATLAKKSVFAMFTGSTQKYEDAAELFTKAGSLSSPPRYPRFMSFYYYSHNIQQH